MSQAVVVAAFIVEDGKVLLTRRSDTKTVAPGLFHLPGGHVEFGEQPQEALRRELAEELSILTPRIGPPFAAFGYTTPAGVHTIAIAYLVAPPSGPIRLDGTENVAMVWAAADELGLYLAPDDPVYEAALEGFACAAKYAGFPVRRT